MILGGGTNTEQILAQVEPCTEERGHRKKSLKQGLTCLKDLNIGAAGEYTGGYTQAGTHWRVHTGEYTQVSTQSNSPCGGKRGAVARAAPAPVSCDGRAGCSTHGAGPKGGHIGLKHT